jgi:opacity protein-like surface antigen
MFRNFRMIALQLLILVITTSGFAQSNRIGFFLNAAGFFPTQKNINLGIGSGLGGIIYLNSEISISLEWKYSRLQIDKEENRFLNGTLTMTPLVASIRYNLSMNEIFSPYVFVGGGLFFNSFRLSENADLEEVNIRKQIIKTGLGFSGGIGSTIKLTDRFSMFLEGLYLRRTANAETVYLNNSPPSAFRVDLSSFSVLIGLNYTY